MAEQMIKTAVEDASDELDENALASLQDDPRLDGPDDEEHPKAAPAAVAPDDAGPTPAGPEKAAPAPNAAPSAMTTAPAVPPPVKPESTAKWRFEFSSTESSRLTVAFIGHGLAAQADAEAEAGRLRREVEEAVKQSPAYENYLAAQRKVNALDKPRRQQLAVIADIESRVASGCDPNDLAALAQQEIEAKATLAFAGRALTPAVKEREDAARQVWQESRRIAEAKQMAGMAHVGSERQAAGRMLAAAIEALDRLMAADFLCGLMSGLWAVHVGPMIAGSLCGAEPAPPVRPAAPRNNRPPWSDILSGGGLPGTFQELAQIGTVPQSQPLPATVEQLAAAQRIADEATLVMQGGAR